MKKLIICEGKNDSLFLAALLKKEFKITAAIIGFSELQLDDPPQESTVDILDCNGLDNIRNALELINLAVRSPYHKTPKLIIWDEDPGNKQSKRTKKCCIKKIKPTKDNQEIAQNYDTPFTIESMLEGLIIDYLREEIEQNGQKNGEDKKESKEKKPADYLKKSIECMDAYLKCLSSKKNHAKIRIDLLEKGIFLQKNNNISKHNDSSIIPGIFNHIDFGSDCFKKLREALKKFISDTESVSKPC